MVRELLSLTGVSPVLAAAAAAGEAADLPLLGRVLAAEGAAGRYLATQAFLRLLTTLVSGGRAPRGAAAGVGSLVGPTLQVCTSLPSLTAAGPAELTSLPAAAAPAPALQALVTWVLHRVLPEHRHWRYALRAERWRLAGLALRLVRLSLLSASNPEAPPEGNSATMAEAGASSIAAAVAAVLRYDVGMSACLLPALPHHAEQLEVRAGPGVGGLGAGGETWAAPCP